jgi:ADP-ribose pyrophosphatase
VNPSRPGSEGPELLSREEVYDGRIVRLSLDTVRFPDGSSGTLEVISHAGAAAVVPFIDDPLGPDPRVVLLHQYRYAAGGSLYEVPAGMPLSPEEPWADCARRELSEETGFRAGELRYLSRIYTTPGFTNEVIHLFAAAELGAGDIQLDRDEFIEVHVLPLSEAVEWIRIGKLVDGKSVAALLFAASFVHSVWLERRVPPTRATP